ncbi:MAG TPA: hypothetical protein VD948_06260 [Rhodothermales bacterium]|nr:hypothetical protein [Rhodothermales bacterium]
MSWDKLGYLVPAERKPRRCGLNRWWYIDRETLSVHIQDGTTVYNASISVRRLERALAAVRKQLTERQKRP